tara:strand:- start:445 stop:1620 length:1176 start_codon:yes stop_codon:yes gene_type:complete
MKKYILFISYDGLLDPLGQSQILPYIYGLNELGYNFIILSYEKECRDEDEINKLSMDLQSRHIIWFKLKFIRGKIKRIFRILNGAILVRKLNRKFNIRLVHLRALQPGLIYWLSYVKKPFIYDMRAFAGQWVDMGAIRKGSLLELIVKQFELILIKSASAFVVLDKSGERYLKEAYKVNKPFKVIPTSTDVSKYNISEQNCLLTNRNYKFVFLGGARFPYLPKMALKFINQLIKHGYNCQIDFINESDQEFILNACNEVGFSQSKIKLFSLKRKDVFKVLPSYDCGLAFIATGPWLRMCSPTKIGEYLSAGLNIVGLEGLEVMDRLAKETNSVDVLSIKQGDIFCSKETSERIINKINSPKRQLEAIKVASKNYTLNQALNNYANLYSKLV